MASSLSNPTYGELIDIFEKFRGEKDSSHLIISEVTKRYPCVSVSRPSRFVDSIQRIVAPTEPSLRGPAKLTGSPLATYRRRVWEPRIRNTSKMVNKTGLMLQTCSHQVEDLSRECSELREELISSRDTLRVLANEKQILDAKCKRLAKLKGKNQQLEQECFELRSENLNLHVDLEMQSDSDESTTNDDSFDSAETKFQNIIGCHKYTPEIRKLYYSLLADQVPASKIPSIIQSVLKCFHPTLDVEVLKLPQKSCASYMRKDELKTVADAHKVHAICSDSCQGDGIHLNTDGTTKHQKKLAGVVANDMVMSVNEVADGRAVTAVNDISREFEKLRRVAEMLGLPNPNAINWTLVKSSTSDSASTQKCLNKLIAERRESDEEKFGPAVCTSETLDLIETFCSMHLGVNLRKAFLKGTSENEAADTRYHKVDTIVHEFCKLFGRTGGPEYACGVLSFPDFLELQASQTENEEQAYYKACLKVNLHRQIGSRYFVTASNACKVLFLKDAAIEFLKFTGKDSSGNKLERDVFAKLHDPSELVQLQADSLMYYHVYADLYMLSKSTDLGLTVLSMNQHYLELHEFLSEVEANPTIVFERQHRVFLSEKRIYDSDDKVNHRMKSEVVYEKLFNDIEPDDESLLDVLNQGAIAMNQKLLSYAADQLPGGRFWEPDEETKQILDQLKPSNDVCESVLGLNDYLTTAIPNLHQMARSTLIQVKKNKTMKWLASLPADQQKSVIDLAVKQRRCVSKECQDEEKIRRQQRQEKMLKENARRRALEKKLSEEREKLSDSHLITSSKEVEDELLAIDKEAISEASKVSRKIRLLKTQVRIRRKVLGQKVPIVFTIRRKQRPFVDLSKELCEFIDKNPVPVLVQDILRNPASLVGKKIKHRFLEEKGGSAWYLGTIVEYSEQKKTHCVTYEGELEHYHFDLTIDLILGDAIVL